jgi:hypothetical protein
MLLDWVNSINTPSCLLASSTQDLRSGVVLCDLLAHFQQSPPYPEVERNVIGDTWEEAKHNLNFLVAKLHQILPGKFSPRQLYEVGDS